MSDVEPEVEEEVDAASEMEAQVAFLTEAVEIQRRYDSTRREYQEAGQPNEGELHDRWEAAMQELADYRLALKALDPKRVRTEVTGSEGAMGEHDSTALAGVAEAEGDAHNTGG